MPSVFDTIRIAQLSLAMARVDVDKSSFRGPFLDYLLPWKIKVLKKSVQWAFDQSETYPDLEETSNFLYAMLDKYGILATDALSIATPVVGGPVISIVTASSIFPLYKTSEDFSTANLYPDTRLFGNEIRVFIDEINRNLFDDEFYVDADGLHVIYDGFDASVNQYHLEIKKVNP